MAARSVVRLVLAMTCLGATLNGVQAAEPDDVATRFFKTHPHEIDATEQAGSVLFANRHVGLEFRKSQTGFELARLYGIPEGRDFLTVPKAGQPRNLFEIRMALDPKRVAKDERSLTKEVRIGIVLDRMAEMGKAFVIGSQAGKSVSWRHEQGEKESVLHLEWKGIDVQEEKTVFSAEVTVRLRAGDPISYWRIALHNRSQKYGIERVRLPILPLAPIGEAAQNVFIFPKWRGGLVEDPFNAPAGFGENYHTAGAFYPYYVNMQFWALYNKTSNQGIYLGTQDPTPNLSQFLIDNTPAEIAWSVSHFPPNISFAAEDFVLPYDCVAGPFQGDWFDACRIYREWAVKQSWCAKGPLTTRNDIPQWYKEAPLYFYTVLADSATGTHSQEENLLLAAEHFRQWLKWAGVKLPVNWYGFEKEAPGLSWHDRPSSPRRAYGMNSNVGRWTGFASQFTSYAGNYPAVPAMEKFSAMCKSLREEGGMVCPYVCLQLLNQGPLDNAPFAAEGRLWVARETYGAMETYPGLGTWLPCVCTPWWQKRMVDECLTLLEREHVGGFYLDVMHGTGMPCFWTPHGHAHAGGSTMTKGMHDLSRVIRDAVKAKDPEVITTGEDACENMIDVIDGILYQRTLRPENKVPLFGAVYQDYIPRYGMELTAGPGDDFYIECASLFVEGAQVGRIRLRPRSGVLSLQDPDHREMLDFLGRIVGYYKQETAKKFLVYGRLMRPLAFRTPSPLPMLTHGNADGGSVADTGALVGKDGSHQFPVLMSGVFRTEDGELGVFVVNTGAAELAFAAPFDSAAHGMTKDASVEVTAITPQGRASRLTQAAKGSVLLEGSLPGHGMTLFVLKPSTWR